MSLSPKALEYLEWHLLPEDERYPATQNEWCDLHDVPRTNPARWKKQREFKEATTEALHDENVDDGNIEAVVAELRKAALAGDVAAMKAYMQYATAFDTDDDETVRGMSDEELAVALEEAAAEVRARL